MRYSASVTAVLACLALGPAAANAQQRPDAGLQSRAEMGGSRGAPSEQQVRNFFDQTEQTLRQAVRNQGYRQAAQYIRRHLAEDATFVATNSLSIDGRQVATSVVTVDDDTFSDILGFAASAMQGGGRKNVQGYRLEIDVRDIQPLRGENAVRVSTVIRESGQLQAGQEGLAGAQVRQQQSQIEPMQQTVQQWQQRQRDLDQQAQGNQRGQGWSQAQRDQMAGMDAFEQGSGDQRGALTRGIGAQQAQFQSTAQCEHVMRLGPDGNVRIGSSVCRGNTQIRSQS